ncbi:nucleotidyltransferase domain-containing protein [Pseudomonas stutzeri]|nr:nucleotidyltransferase domain-containing protein [Stutzerimonas stutzeri]MBK3877456.1 nucleotidyltransferase domain-containing protein [Stutzerimonas stutzeri]HBM09165.1 hypothetical protein [Pseudomonas sp.]
MSEAILYGSRAKGNYRPGSDIDLDRQRALTSGSTRYRAGVGWPTAALQDRSIPTYQLDNPQLIDHIDRVGKLFYKAAS